MNRDKRPIFKQTIETNLPSPPKQKRLTSPRKRPIPGQTTHIPDYYQAIGISPYRQWDINQEKANHN